MDKSNLNTNDNLIKNNIDEENSPLSSSFVLQPYSNDIKQQEENIQYKLKSPLCVSHIYEEEFFDRFHMNYYGELEHGNLFLVSIRSTPVNINEIDYKSSNFSSTTNINEDYQLIRAIIRTDNNNYDVSEIINIKDEENMLQILFEKVQLPSIHYYGFTHYIKANEKILEFDKYNDEQNSNKIAFIFQRLNQVNENEILSNNEISIKMENFLNLISERIELKDFKKYRGDLDIKINQHGIYSYFTIYHSHQIMFNIAPIIPSNDNDKEFIQRKSLIANALLCIVFQEEGTLFQPDFILGKVTQVFITIQPIEIHNELYYKIEIWRRSDIEPIIDPSGGIYKHDKSFRDYFLTLILNTMNSILKKEYFHLRIIKQRQRLKNEYLQKLCQMFYSYSQNHLSISYDHSDSDMNSENSNIEKESSSGLHRLRRLSFISKFIGTFIQNQPNLSLQSKGNVYPSFLSQNSVLHQQEESEEKSDAIKSLIKAAATFVEINNEISLSASTIDNTAIDCNGHNRNHTNSSLMDNNNDKLNKNQNTKMKLTN